MPKPEPEGAEFQSTPSVWRETATPSSRPVPLDISIHSLRVEGDARDLSTGGVSSPISIHSLRVEGDGAVCLLQSRA